ncbi:DUF4142 domain-containing protein [Roseococcus sp. YIM B11640]|uniref:DUF4142 domain-containing protein n=1 Tax=Roseococcus sp. YIM B11640 TaxID=3133973 RepID=UPI003C7C90BF
MQRRHVAAGLAGTTLLAAGEAMAQAVPPAPRVTVPQAPGAPPSRGPATDPWRQGLEAGILSLVTSQIAESRAASPQVKAFASFEVAEQRSIVQAQQLAGLPVPPQLKVEGDEARLVQQLETASGEEFDRLYLRLQLASHQQLLALHQRFRANGSREQKIISTMAAVTAEQHLRLLQGIQRQG